MLLPSDLIQFTGTENYFKSQLPSLWYTDGCQYFFRNAGDHGAYWFLDLIQFDVLQHDKTARQDFLVIEMHVTANKAVLQVSDGNDKYLLNREIQYTDLADGLWRFYIELAECGGVCGKLMMLPSER
ncbi:MAG: DUF6876 family protein [Methylobacter sp.]